MRLRDRTTSVARGGKPRFLGLLELGEGLLGGCAERRASVEVGHIGDVAAVLVAVEEIDVVVAHRPFRRKR